MLSFSILAARSSSKRRAYTVTRVSMKCFEAIDHSTIYVVVFVVNIAKHLFFFVEHGFVNLQAK